jgi:polyketide cyclase/dehydrase/lipid transport protein
MAHEFSGSAVIDRPINQVFEFLADGTNDPTFSPRVQEIRQTTDGPVGVGTVFESTVKDAGMTTKRSFELTEFNAPTKIRWTERSKNMVTVPEGGYDFEPVSDNETRFTIHNVFEGHGFGKLVVGFAARAAVKDAPAFAQRIKSAVEKSAPAGDGAAGGPTADVSGEEPPAAAAEPAAAADEPAGAADEPAAAADEPAGAADEPPAAADEPPAAADEPPGDAPGPPAEPPEHQAGQ